MIKRSTSLLLTSYTRQRLLWVFQKLSKMVSGRSWIKADYENVISSFVCLVENRFRIKQNFEDLKKASAIVCMIGKKLHSQFRNFSWGLRVPKHKLNEVTNKTVTMSEWMSKCCQDTVVFKIRKNRITWIKNLIETQILYWKSYEGKIRPEWIINWIQSITYCNQTCPKLER